MDTVSFQELKRPERGVDHQLTFSAEFHITSVPVHACYGAIFTCISTLYYESQQNNKKVSIAAILLTRGETKVFELRNNILFVSYIIKEFISWVIN
jgi:hypothetical protein